ncbi:hypothetical protein JCM10207_003292 [Rhodosporidiobolus poonsookiae]
MSARTDIRVPPLKYLVAGAAALFTLVLVAFAAHSPEAFSKQGYLNLRNKLGLGSDGMPLNTPGAAGAVNAAAAEGRTSGLGGAEDWALKGGETNGTLANAAFVFLARNRDLWDVVSAMQSLQDRIPKLRPYPWVFLNDEAFTDEFKRHTSQIAGGPCHYGLVPKEHWEEPSWIDENKAAAERQKMVENKVIYGGSKTYRRMCRFQSGYFYRHPLVQQYDYYMRIDPGVKFLCDVDYDPFVMMRDQKKKYAFTVSLYEYESTIPTLWQTTKDFIKEHPEHLAKPNAMDWVSNDGGETYNRCHFWSNFEIGDLNFFRSQAYSDYFDHLDRAGGFSYERWGDAPVHSIAAALFLRPDELHYFSDFGYYHIPFTTCPPDAGDKRTCTCNPKMDQNFYDFWYSCSPKWRQLYGGGI